MLLRRFSASSLFQATICAYKKNIPRYLRCSTPIRLLSIKSGSEDASKDHFDASKRAQLNRILTVPNAITACRILCSPLITYAIVEDMKEIALVGCVVAGISDWLDGYIAKNYNSEVRPDCNETIVIN